MHVVTCLTILSAGARLTIAAAGFHPSFLGLQDDNNSDFDASMNSLVPRGADLDWNQTWIDNQRKLCSDEFASQQCCPGYCSVDYKNPKGDLFYTCCPRGYYAAAFGRINSISIQCCNNTVTPCEKGKGTKKAVTPFENSTTDVAWLEQQCYSDASSLMTHSTVIIATVLGWMAWDLLV